MSSDQISFSLSLSSEVDILIYKVADVDRRRDRSIPRGNNGENYEGTRTHFPSLPTPEGFSCYELSKRSRAEVGGGTRGNTRLGNAIRVLFRDANSSSIDDEEYRRSRQEFRRGIVSA